MSRIVSQRMKGAFARRLREAIGEYEEREGERVTQARLALEAGAGGRSAANLWCRGQRIPANSAAFRLAQFLGVEVMWLINGEGPKRRRGG
jgi:transcriptional regulator with XRE-family HTH domain